MLCDTGAIRSISSFFTDEIELVRLLRFFASISYDHYVFQCHMVIAQGYVQLVLPFIGDVLGLHSDEREYQSSVVLFLSYF